MEVWDIAVWRMLWPLWTLFVILSNGARASQPSEAPDETCAEGRLADCRRECVS